MQVSGWNTSNMSSVFRDAKLTCKLFLRPSSAVLSTRPVVKYNCFCIINEVSELCVILNILTRSCVLRRQIATVPTRFPQP